MVVSCSLRAWSTLLKDDESARDNHVLACNFAKYSPILTFFYTHRLSNKPFCKLLPLSISVFKLCSLQSADKQTKSETRVSAGLYIDATAAVQ